MGFNETRMANRPVTHEGGRAHYMDPSHELYLLVVSSLLSGDSFYETQDDRVERLQTLVRAVLLQGDVQFVKGLAAYAREQMYLRTAPTVLTAELFMRGQDEAAAQAAERVWVRGDEHLEALAYFKTTGAKRTKALLRAVAKRLNQMDEYGMAKYAAGRKSYSQRDAIRVAHPVPKDEAQSALFKYVVHGWDKLDEAEQALLPHIAKLKAGGTQSWEQHISKEGSTKETWAEAVPKMGYMALLRNLRNLVENGMDGDTLMNVVLKISNADQVAKSKQLPFRFLSAFQALPSGTPQALIDAVCVAADHAVANVPDLDGETLVLVDCSGSMTWATVSGKSKVKISDAARCLGAILVRRGDCTLYGFGDRPVRVTAPSGNSVMATVAGMRGISRKTGHCTMIGKALSETLDDRFKRAIVLTDLQAHDHVQPTVTKWLAGSPERKLYVIDLSSYGLPSIDPRHPQITMVGGFSDKVFDWIVANEVADPLRKIKEYAG